MVSFGVDRNRLLKVVAARGGVALASPSWWNGLGCGTGSDGISGLTTTIEGAGLSGCLNLWSCALGPRPGLPAEVFLPREGAEMDEFAFARLMRCWTLGPVPDGPDFAWFGGGGGGLGPPVPLLVFFDDFDEFESDDLLLESYSTLDTK
jgi:hypothetical protein